MRYPVAPRARARLVKNTQLGETFQLPVDNDFNRFFGFNNPSISGADSVDCERWEEFFYEGFPLSILLNRRDLAEFRSNLLLILVIGQFLQRIDVGARITGQ